MAATNQEMLDAVNDAIQAHVTGGAIQSYSIDGRNLARTPLPDLMKLRSQLQAEVASGKGTRNYVSFRKPL